MGFVIVLQDENGNNISAAVQDSSEVLPDCLPKPDDTSYACARFIDPYGDTVFNHLQASLLLDEWDRLRPSFIERDAGSLWSDIRALMARCLDEPHSYLRFIGE